MLFIRLITPLFVTPLYSHFLARIRLGFMLILLSCQAMAVDSEADAEDELVQEQPADQETLTEEATAEEMPTKDTLAPPLSRYQPNIPLKRAQALLHHMTLMNREDEIIRLQSPEDFYGLYLPNAEAPQGGVLILHDQQQHGHWPDIIGPLRDYLPNFGWSTLTIELPDPPKRQRIPRTETSTPEEKNDVPVTEQTVAAEQATTSDQNTVDSSLATDKKDNAGPTTDADNINADVDDNAEPALPRLQRLPDIETAEAALAPEDNSPVDNIKQFQQQNRSRVLAAIDFLHSKNQYNLVIIGYGQGAAWAIDYVHQQLADDEEPKGLTLVTIDALPDAYNKQLMNKQLVDISTPYLDLLRPTEWGYTRAAQKRVAIMKRNNNEQYRQIITQTLSSYDEIENPTNRRIRGWIMTHAGGTQIKMKQ